MMQVLVFNFQGHTFHAGDDIFRFLSKVEEGLT